MKLFISYRSSDTSCVGEIFEYLESKPKLGAFSSRVVLNDHHSIEYSAEALLLSFIRPLNCRHVISALSSALEIYEKRQAMRRVAYFLKLPFHNRRLPRSKRCSRPWRDVFADNLSSALANSDTVLFLLGDSSTSWDDASFSSRMSEKPWKCPDMLEMAEDASWRMPATSEKPGLEGSNSVAFSNRRPDTSGAFDMNRAFAAIDPAGLHVDYCNLGSTGIDWPGPEFLLQMHSDAASDGTAALLSAWRQPDDPLNCGIFLGQLASFADGYHMRPHMLSYPQGKQGTWPSWLRFLFRFRIRKRRKIGRAGVHRMGRGAGLRAFANHHFRRVANLRPIAPGLQTLGQLFIGSGGTLDVGWELRQRAEQLLRNRLTNLSVAQSCLFADTETVYALYRGRHRASPRTGSRE
jgi:hypothetical protein